MPKKKFIDKKASTTYSVVHRSQQDGAWGIEDRPSERVLLAQRPVNAHGVKRAANSEVTARGFANDGYDYESHLAEIGGGAFVSADGGVGTAAARCRSAPRRDRPRVRGRDPDPALMDGDVADALFDDAAFEGCEELLDDFVVDAAQAPEGEEEDVFDYDAHIARLIANAGSGHLHDDDDDDDEGWDSDAETADGGPRGDVDAAFDAALADYDSDEDEYDDDDDDDDDGVASGVARIALEEAGGVLEAMMDEAVKDREAFLHGEDQSFFDPQGPADIVVEGEELSVVEGEADRELDAMYAAEDAKELEDAPQWDCESILSTTGETPEEKKARKAAAKAAQRDQRAAKKDTKLAWKDASARAPQAHAAAPSVFSF
ncbi:hypothetical protein JL722_8704 [Aureococcus anophagefferens]|nr:hypothetical protein JL722_8704 [Aureococcus anophagefferens]